MTTGCSNGRLTNPEAYFFTDVIRRPKGSPADDWKQVLQSLRDQGMGINPQPGERQPMNAPFYGFTLMIGDGGRGEPRGRIWLPTTAPVISDGNPWYTREVQVIADGPTPGSIVWAWTDKGGGPYEARPCEGDSLPGGGGGGGTDPALEQRVATLERQMATTLKDGEGLSLWCANGTALCAEDGGPSETHQEFFLRSRNSAGGWETWIARRVK